MHIGALCQLLFGILKRTQIVIHYENTILEYIDITGNTVTASTSGKPVRIQAVARASAIIDVIANAGEEGVGLSEISRVTELTRQRRLIFLRHSSRFVFSSKMSIRGGTGSDCETLNSVASFNNGYIYHIWPDPYSPISAKR